MRYVFILNPTAGKGDAVKKILPSIEKYFTDHGGEYTTYIADTLKKAIDFSRAVAQKNDPVRIFAVGGDGTLFAITNGVAGFANVEIGNIPCGSGNDFIKCFGKAEAFLDLGAQLEGEALTIDTIRSGDYIGIDICSMGMDAMVADKILKYKRIPFLSGSVAYQLAVITTILGKIGVHLDITIDGGKKFSGDYLFALAANGQYYGGGYRGAPDADPTDGLLDFVLIKTTPKLRIFSLLKIYKAGKHKDLDIVTIVRGKKMDVRSPVETAVNMDGDVIRAKNITFEVMPGALKFILPKGVRTYRGEPEL